MTLGLRVREPRPAPRAAPARAARGRRQAPPRPRPSNPRACSRARSSRWFDRLMQPFAGKQATEGGEDALAPCGAGSPTRAIRRETSVITYMGSRVVFALAAAAARAADAGRLGARSRSSSIVALCAAAGLGLVAPSYWLDQKVKARQKSLRLALPDALDLMVVCVEAGLGINASLKRVARGLPHAPIRSSPTEFELANFETRAGKSTTDALRALADRTGVSGRELARGDADPDRALRHRPGRHAARARGRHAAAPAPARRGAGRTRRRSRCCSRPSSSSSPCSIIIVGPGFLQMTEYFRRPTRDDARPPAPTARWFPSLPDAPRWRARRAAGARLLDARPHRQATRCARSCAGSRRSSARRRCRSS